MAQFHMFLKTPPGLNPAGQVEEQSTYGPTGSAFSEKLVLRMKDGATDSARQVYAICDGLLRLEVEPAAGPSTVRLVLTPSLSAGLSLLRIAEARGMIVPSRFTIGGIDPTDLEVSLQTLVGQATVDPEIMIAPSSQEKIDLFLEGSIAIAVKAGHVLAWARNELHVQVLTKNFHLDPVSLFAALADDPNSELDGAENSWLEVVDNSRVLLSIQDEWNQPLTGETLDIRAQGVNTSFPLTVQNRGTVVANGPGALVCKVQDRILTHVAGAKGKSGSEELAVAVTAPNHLTISSVNPESWFQPQTPALSDNSKALSRYTEGNKVEPLIDGLPTFARVLGDLRAISDPQHFAYFANWFFDPSFPLVPGDPSTTLEEVLTGINRTGAKIRAMIWDNWLYAWFSTRSNPLAEADQLINGLSNGKSIIDHRNHHVIPPQSELLLYSAPAVGGAVQQLLAKPVTGFFITLVSIPALYPFASQLVHLGAHHWKVTVIKNDRGIAAYLGGIDFNTDRLDDPDHLAKHPYHDVHCRIEGPASYDVGKAYIDRWNDHPFRPGGENLSTTVLDNLPSAGTCMVQIARTYGATTQSYAPDGDRTIWATLKQAVLRARKYIYIEDQYLSYMSLSDVLLTALDRIDHLMIVVDGVDGSGDGSFKSWDPLRHPFLKQLYEKAPHKLHVFVLKNKNGIMCKIHTKVVIIDDVFATIGSANMAQRSMTHDSEINAFVLDSAVESGARKFARDLRVRLWSEHLGCHREEELAVLTLGNIDRAFEVILNSPPDDSRLHRYPLRLDRNMSPTLFGDVFDPDGSLPPT